MLAGGAVTTGTNNTLIGGLAGDALTAAFENTAVGESALGSDTLGRRTVAIGSGALQTQNYTTATNSYNVAVGYDAGVLVTTGIHNTMIGGLAGDALTDADHNVAVGTEALTSDTMGSKSTAIGYNTLATDTYNTAVGYGAGISVTTGIQNTLIGSKAGDALTDADFNVAVGMSALGVDTLGSKSIAIGTGALSTQNFTTATDTFNVAVGYQAGNLLTTGTYNTFLGPQAGFNITNGSQNTIIGQFDGNNQGLDIRTASNNIVLSDGAGAVHLRTHVVSSSQRQIEIGHYGSGSSNQDFVTFLASDGDSQPSAANKHGLILSNGISGAQVKVYAFGTGSWTAVEFLNTHGHTGQQIGSITLTENATAYNTSSDYRLKTDAQPMTGATDRLKQLNPVNFEWIADGTRVDGFLAHEAQAVVPESVTGVKDAMRDEEYEVTPAVTDDDGNVITEAVMGTRSVPDYQGIDQSKLVPLLVATIQELEARITALENA
jgi:hypothetical protein